jgi:hypothetical protein
MSANARGELAIWSTIDPKIETDYLHWLTREHLLERVGIPGFRSGRVFRRKESLPSEYMILYELDSADVMHSVAYLERLNNPSQWTRRIMPQLGHFRRGGGTVEANADGLVGAGGHGAHLAVARFVEALPKSLQGDAGASLVRSICECDRISRARVTHVSNEATTISTREKALRTSAEGAFAGLLIIEALSTEALGPVLTRLDEQGVVARHAFEIYDSVFFFRE